MYSCSDSDNDSSANTTLLQKVVFPSNFDREWHFYDNGLVKEMAGSNGYISESFSYDENGNLTALTNHIQPAYSYSFTYDGNIITSVNGHPVAYGYDPAGGKYTFEFDVPAGESGVQYPYRTEIIVNPEMLPLSRTIFYLENGQPTSKILRSGAYQNGNQYLQVVNGPFNFEFDAHPNPFKQALLPVCRPLALADVDSDYIGDTFYHSPELTSINNVIELNYGPEWPESTTYTYTYNAAGYPTSQTSQYHSDGPTEIDPVVEMQIYYQGDVIPN